MNRILAVCTDNECRSPMAEGIIRRIVEESGIEGIEVASAGLSAEEGEAPSGYAVEALREIGVDISAHRSRPVLKEDLLNADCIYVMTGQHRDVILEALPELLPRLVVMDVADPAGQELERYRECRDEMLDYFRRELTGE